MCRFLFFILFIFKSFFAFSLGESPQQLVGSLDVSLKGIKKSTLDSLKSSLSSRYVEDYRTYGSKAAYDSLLKRVHVLAAANEHNTSDTLASTKFIEQPMSELDRLKQENQSLKNELNIIKNGPAPEREMTPLQKRTWWIVRQLVNQNNAAADTLWKVYSDKSFGKGPLYFDSISTRALQPFMPPIVKPKYLMAPVYKAYVTPFELLCERNDIRNLVKDKVTFSLVGRDPSVFDYYKIEGYYSSTNLDIVNQKRTTGLKTVETDYLSIDVKKPKVEKTNKDPWTTTAKLSAHFSEYYVSETWYKGGDPNGTVLLNFEGERNYKKDRKIWDNNLEIKFGFYMTSVDTLHHLRVNNDLLKLHSTIGYLLFGAKWYGVAYGEFNTTMFPNYKKSNSDELVATFMSPTRIFLAPGMKYDYNSNVFSIMSPLAYKHIFIINNDVDPESVGILKHHKNQGNIGFFGKGRVKWKFTKDLNLQSTFDIFVAYNRDLVRSLETEKGTDAIGAYTSVEYEAKRRRAVEFNWETVGNFVINRFLSTKLSLNMRFDNTPKTNNDKLQIQQQLSFGFNYNFQ